MSGPFLKHSTDYNDLNLSIIPCGKKKGKEALVSWKEYQAECADLSVFNMWNEDFPFANIGLITGRLNDITVIDCDDPNISVRQLQEEYGETSLIVETPRGGKHLYYKYNRETSRNNFLEKIDIKSDGGYVVGPYSINPENGIPYRIIKGSLDDICSLLPSTHPSLPKKRGVQSIKHITQPIATSQSQKDKIQEGQRNNYLFKITKDYAATVNTYEEILVYAQNNNQNDLIPPLPNSEVYRIVNSVWKYKKEDRLHVSGGSYVQIHVENFEMLCKSPRALSLYILLLRHHKNRRKNFTIIHEKVAEILGCDRKTIPKAIDELIDKKIILRVHTSKGKNDGHQYEFI